MQPTSQVIKVNVLLSISSTTIKRTGYVYKCEISLLPASLRPKIETSANIVYVQFTVCRSSSFGSLCSLPLAKANEIVTR